MTLLHVLSFIGTAAVLIPYVMQQRGVWRPSSGEYQLYNLAGAVALAFCALAAKQWAFVVLNVVWAFEAGRAYITGYGPR